MHGGKRAFNLSGQLGLLSQMIEEISGELSLQPLMERIVERARSLLEADDGVIGLYSPQHGAIRTAAVASRPIEQTYPYIYPGQGLVGQVLATQAPVSARYGDLPNPLDNEHPDMRVIGVPIRRHDELIGVFCVASRREDYLDGGRVELLSLFARHAAIAIDNARRYSREQRRAFRFALIANVAAMSAAGADTESLLQRVADTIHETLAYPSVDIPLLDAEKPDALLIRARSGRHKHTMQEGRMSVSAGIMGAAVRSRRIQLVNDVSRDPRYIAPPDTHPAGAELAIPIQHGGEVLGVLNVEGEGPFDELDCASLEIVAERLAVAIVHGRLQQRARQAALLEERQRLARDLHDNVTQILASMSLIAQSLPGAWRGDAGEGQRLAVRLGELSQLAFAELRGMLRELSSEPPAGADAAAQPDLPAALQKLVRIMVPSKVRLEFEVADYRPQAPQHEEAMLRVCQEAVSNAVRHAGPQRIDVTLRLSDDALCASVSDDGRGMAQDARPGMGLKNMRERLQELGGSLRISARRTGGTRVAACLPRRDRPMQKSAETDAPAL